MAEVLEPTRRPIGQEFERGFVGMTERVVLLEELEATREQLIAEVVGGMPEQHRRFLIGFKAGRPDWGLLEAQG